MTDQTPAPVSPIPAAAPAPAAPGTSYPGKTLGIVGLILTFFVSIVGLILSIVARSQSKAAGYKNTPATVGIILGIIFLVLGIVFAIIGSVLSASVLQSTTY